MRSGSDVLTAALMGVLALSCSPTSAQPDSRYDSAEQVDVGIFYDSLAPYGEWVEMPDYGWSWAPRVERGWRPYTRGQWIMTDDGWFWDSDERFGWAAYHYGRWVNDPYYGWVWVPGIEWAPAWVSWRHGDGYTGWAPLPPRATWRTRVGLSIGGLDLDAFIGARDYTFVRDRSFVDRSAYRSALPQTQNVTIIKGTQNVTRYAIVDDRVVNSGIDVANVERAVGRRVPRTRTVDVDRADAPRRETASEIAVFRPLVRAAPERRPTQGRSLVKGEEPPPLLVERRALREQERQQKGNQAEATAKAVQQQRPAVQPRAKEPDAAEKPQARRTDAKARPQAAQRQPIKTRQDAATQRANDQGRQRRGAQPQADQRAKDAQQARDQTRGDQAQSDQQKADQRGARRGSDGKSARDVQPEAKGKAEGRVKKGSKAGQQQ